MQKWKNQGEMKEPRKKVETTEKTWIFGLDKSGHETIFQFPVSSLQVYRDNRKVYES